MSDVKWIKIVTDIFDDEKIRLIESLPDAYALIVVWFKILCLAGKSNCCGVLMMNDRIAYTDDMLATLFRMPANTVRLALDTFEQFGMIERTNNTICVSNWEKHQNIDGMELIREQNRVRKQNQRQRERLAIEMSRDSHVTVTQSHATDIDIDIDKDLKEILPKGSIKKSFHPPTLEEVKNYCSERHNSIDAERFLAYYESNGWMVGKNHMKDWKAAVRTWEQRDKKDNQPSWERL